MRRLLIVTVLALAAGIAHADDGLLYLGAGIARNTLKDIAATNADLDSTSWKVFAGFRPIGLFAVEADYIDLGSQTINSSSLDTATHTHLRYKAFAGYAVGFAPIPVPYLDVFGKLGLARWNASGGSTNTIFPATSSFLSRSDQGTQFAWGVGAQLHAGHIGGRLEYENFNIRNTNGANVVSLSVFLNFL
jgi:Outer membrane protein beta-barrel domain